MGDTLQSMATEISKSNSSYKMWDKGQLIVILSRTKTAKDTIFVGNKSETIEALKSLLTKRTQWSDYIETVLSVITINTVTSIDSLNTNQNCVLTQNEYPYRICDVTLPQCNTGYVYMLISVKDMNFTYIGKTMSIRKRLQQHNTGIGSVSTEPRHLRPYALLAYMCGFQMNNDLLFYMERRWKEERDHLIRNNTRDAREWALCGSVVINELNTENYGLSSSDITLVCLFKE